MEVVAGGVDEGESAEAAASGRGGAAGGEAGAFELLLDVARVLHGGDARVFGDGVEFGRERAGG